MSDIVIKKFGGTSVGSALNMSRILDIILKDDSNLKIIVLSALSGTTNTLAQINALIAERNKKEASVAVENLKQRYLEFLQELLKEETLVGGVYSFLDDRFFKKIKSHVAYANLKAEKEILAMGEQMSSFIFSEFLQSKNIKYTLWDALSLIKTNKDDQPNMPFIEKRVSSMLKKNKEHIVVTQGYICLNYKGEIDNLKRGGSDYSASIIAAATGAKRCEIWTDIDGMHNNDPRIVAKTYPIKNLSFEEASELAYFGAKVLHPTCIIPAQQKGIPVKILNTMRPEAEGTTISDERVSVGEKAVAAKDDISAIRIKSGKMLMAYGFLTQVFAIFEKYKTPIDMITTSEVAISLTIDNVSHLGDIKKELEKIGSVDVDHGLSIICIVGYQLVDSSDLLSKIFNALNRIPIRMVSYGGSKNNISLLAKTNHKKEILQNLNASLFGLE